MLSASPSKVTLSRQNAASWTHPQHNTLWHTPDVSLSTHPAYHSDRERSSSPSPGCQASITKSAVFAPVPLQPFIATNTAVRPVRRIRYSRLRLSASAYSAPPFLAGRRHDWVPEFRTGPHDVLAPLRRTPPGQSEITRRLVPGKGLGPGFDVGFLLLTRHRGFAFAQLRGAHLTGVPLPFPTTAQDPALNRRPCSGWIPLRRVDPGGPGADRRLLLHLLHSTACCCDVRTPLPPSAFSAQALGRIQRRGPPTSPSCICRTSRLRVTQVAPRACRYCAGDGEAKAATKQPSLLLPPDLERAPPTTSRPGRRPGHRGRLGPFHRKPPSSRRRRSAARRPPGLESLGVRAPRLTL